MGCSRPKHLHGRTSVQIAEQPYQETKNDENKLLAFIGNKVNLLFDILTKQLCKEKATDEDRLFVVTNVLENTAPWRLGRAQGASSPSPA